MLGFRQGAMSSSAGGLFGRGPLRQGAMSSPAGDRCPFSGSRTDDRISRLQNMFRMRRLTILLCMLLTVVSCGRRRKAPASDAAAERPAVFLPALPPSRLGAAEQQEWLRWHYWDRFNFSDTLFLARADTAQLVEAYARYIILLSDRPTDGAPIDTLMRRASTSRPMLDYFAMMARMVLHDPNSPLRNDEFYIPVLEAQLRAPWYDEYERIAPQYDLQIARQNRIGQLANDFRYTLASGRVGTLYGVKAEYVLLFINNPGCAMCREIREAITSSPMLTEMIERGRLKVLAIYPDEDLTEWRAYRDQMPTSWINAYDDGCVIREKLLYDLHAIPALYLLDRDKRVLVKDSTDVAQIEEVIDRRS